ncbi:MAG: TetR/AcrR family transcriptional regulator [Blastochloris sp.]|nr:TetR/AcrR family transcriptional regulator [Blastochloris sp.]
MSAQRPSLLQNEQLPPEPKQERSRQKREALLKAAQSLFAELGYEAVSIGDIAGRAGVAVGAFYQHFTSKRQLVLLLMDQLLAHASALIEQTPPAAIVDARTAISALVRQSLQLDWAYAGAYRAWCEVSVYDPELRVLHLQIEQWSAHRIETLLTMLQQAPNARPGVNLAVLSHVISQLFWRLIETPLHEPAQAEQIISSVSDLIYHALFTDAEADDVTL